MNLLIIVYFMRAMGQPTITPILLQPIQVEGLCDSDSSDSYVKSSLDIGNVEGMTEFTLATWFKITDQGLDYPIQPLFRISSRVSDIMGTTATGIRAALFISADSSLDTYLEVQYSNTLTSDYSTSQQTVYDYTLDRWIWAAVSISYSEGYINYYAIQPSQPNVFVAESINVGVNFNTPLTQSDTIINVLYWGNYLRFCGVYDSLLWIPYHFESDRTHNWMNLVFLSDNMIDFDLMAYYKLEDQEGQVIQNNINQDESGYMGATTGLDINSDAQFNALGFAELQSFQYITLYPFAWMTSTNMIGVSLWFKSDVSIIADADFTDEELDVILIRRVFEGTKDIFLLMIIETTGGYFIKLKLHGVLYTVDSIVISKSVWHFISVRLAYPKSIRDLTRIIYDIIVDQQSQPHTITMQADVWEQSTTDKLTIGDSRNSISVGQNLKISHVLFIPWYIVYVNPLGVEGQTGCLVALQSNDKSVCQVCTPSLYLAQPMFTCGDYCIQGDSGQFHTQLPLCKSCDRKCSSCSSSACQSCSLGYYLSSTQDSCVLATECAALYIANPEDRVCTQCGNGQLDGSESCDDGNLINQDGCSRCQVEQGYTCSVSSPSVCYQQCGDGIIDDGEVCDDQNSIQYDGCYLCLIEDGFDCIGVPITCSRLCGNGKVFGAEQCDDNNLIDGDGCSTLCAIEDGYGCTGGTPVSRDTCTPLCGNGRIDMGEECDDGNIIIGDGCSSCRIEFAWTCDTHNCSKKCGNGLKEQYELCDDGNFISADGCTQCLVDVNYKCNGGSDISVDICVLVTDVCGDSYKKTNEQCEDGNDQDNDGCDSSCHIEEGWECQIGDHSYQKQVCQPICGDNTIIGIEQCDDGNLIDGDGCNHLCQIESDLVICGDGHKHNLEECDDSNLLDGDGCSYQCKVELGWGCNTIIGFSMDSCDQCVYQCGHCRNSTIWGCMDCYPGFVKNELSEKCEPSCPQKFFNGVTGCEACPEGCSSCQGPNEGQCTYCIIDSYLFDGNCLENCDEGYFNQLNAVYGNICQSCFSPCLNCKDLMHCIKCEDLYYLDDNSVCQLCGMGDQCLQCDKLNNQCIQCSLGYYTEDNGCTMVPNECRDGMRYINEQCDDGNQNNDDGCSIRCTIEDGYNCVVENNAPDTCYKLEPLNFEFFVDQVHFDTLYMKFDRPLKITYNFTDLIKITIPSLINYSYSCNQTTQQLVEIKFQFYETVLKQIANIEFPSPNHIIDRFDWSLVGQKDDPLIQTRTLPNLDVELNYFIFYSEEQHQFANSLGVILITFGMLACFVSVSFTRKFGEAKQWKVLEILQILSMLRFINLRYSIHIQVSLQYMNFFSMSFIPNIFAMFDYDESIMRLQMPPNFQIEGYSPLYLRNAGGRLFFISLIIFSINILLNFIVKTVKSETLQQQIHEILSYFQFNLYLRIYEVLFLDNCVALFITLGVTQQQDLFCSVGLILGVVFILFYFAFNICFIIFIVTKNATQIMWLHLRFSCIYDGYNLKTTIGKMYILLSYFQKVLIAFVLVYMKDPVIQIILIVCSRIFIFLPSYKFNPYTGKVLLVRELTSELINISNFCCTLTFLDYYSTEQQKTNSGWILLFSIILNCLHWSAWNFILQFFHNSVKAPEYLAEDHKDDDLKNEQENLNIKQIDYQEVLRKKKLHRKQDARRELDDQKILEAQKQKRSKSSKKNAEKEFDEFFGDIKS